jgi:hypothetical protein
LLLLLLLLCCCCCHGAASHQAISYHLEHHLFFSNHRAPFSPRPQADVDRRASETVPEHEREAHAKKQRSILGMKRALKGAKQARDAAKAMAAKVFFNLEKKKNHKNWSILCVCKLGCGVEV